MIAGALAFVGGAAVVALLARSLEALESLEPVARARLASVGPALASAASLDALEHALEARGAAWDASVVRAARDVALGDRRVDVVNAVVGELAADLDVAVAPIAGAVRLALYVPLAVGFAAFAAGAGDPLPGLEALAAGLPTVVVALAIRRAAASRSRELRADADRFVARLVAAGEGAGRSASNREDARAQGVDPRGAAV